MNLSVMILSAMILSIMILADGELIHTCKYDSNDVSHVFLCNVTLNIAIFLPVCAYMKIYNFS